MKKTVKYIIKKILSRNNFQVLRLDNLVKISNPDIERRLKIMNYYGINILFDIGANSGHYAKTIRELGYTNRIISFEPQKNAFNELYKNSLSDCNWEVNNYAIGNKNGSSIINVSENSLSSSILKMLPKHLETAPESKYIRIEEIEIKKFDTIIRNFLKFGDRVMMKIDTQGFEKDVLQGAASSFINIIIIQLEMSIVQLYENETLLPEMINYLNGKDFQLVSLENGFSDQVTGQLLQVDGIFLNRKFQTNEVE